jgi:basic membrane protein A
MSRMPRNAGSACMPLRFRPVFCTVLLCTAVVLTGCGRTQEEPVLTPVDTLCKAATGDGPKVGIAYDVGGRNDRGINDAAFAGLSEAVDELQATCVEGEAADGEQESARVERLRHFADNGATAIVAIGTRYARAVDTVSQSYPRIQFALIDATAPKRHFGRNVAVLNFDREQIGFLAGVAAALRTKTGKVGFVGAPPDEVLERSEPYEAGFRAGVEAAKPSVDPATPTVEVLAKHLQRDTPAPGKPNGANKTAKGLFEDDGVDVVFGSPGVSQRALSNAARDAGDETWVIGVGADQFQSATEDQKPHILTSVVKRFDTVTYDFLESVAKDAPLTGRHTYGLDEDGIDFVTSGKFLTKRNIAVIDGFKDRVKSGNIKVPDRLG